MNGPRRHLLAASGGLLSSLAGCLSSFSGSDPRDYAPESPGREPGDPTATDADYPKTVRATTTIDRDGLEYVESNDTVRYVAAWRTNHSGETITRKPIYETIGFEEWAETECAHVGAKRVMTAIGERLGEELEGVSAGVTTEAGRKVVVVTVQTLLDRDGDIVSEPSVPYERVEHAAPERVAVTLSFSGRAHSCSVPVKTRQEEIHQQ